MSLSGDAISRLSLVSVASWHNPANANGHLLNVTPHRGHLVCGTQRSFVLACAFSCLFCFFVYLSLFNKPQVDIKTGFKVNEETKKSLTGRLPEELVNSLDSMKGEFHEFRGTFEARLEELI